jgi:hypothetical protein
LQKDEIKVINAESRILMELVGRPNVV